jgi:hypothetical protein
MADEILKTVNAFLYLLQSETQLFQSSDFAQLKLELQNQGNNSYQLAKSIREWSEKYPHIKKALTEKRGDRRDPCEEDQPVSLPDPILEVKEITNTMLCHVIETTERQLAENQPD